MTHSARFWDRIAARYARKPVADEAAYQKKLAVTREYLRPDMEVLEFGCGLQDRLVQDPGAHGVGEEKDRAQGQRVGDPDQRDGDGQIDAEQDGQQSRRHHLKWHGYEGAE